MADYVSKTALYAGISNAKDLPSFFQALNALFEVFHNRASDVPGPEFLLVLADGASRFNSAHSHAMPSAQVSKMLLELSLKMTEDLPDVLVSAHDKSHSIMVLFQQRSVSWATTAYVLAFRRVRVI